MKNVKINYWIEEFTKVNPEQFEEAEFSKRTISFDFVQLDNFSKSLVELRKESTRLVLAVELTAKLEALKNKRTEFYECFKNVCASEKEKQTKDDIKINLFRYHLFFTVEELKEMLESKILLLDSQIKETEEKLHQL